MFEFLLDANYWRDALAFTITAHQAGFNGIPQMGWKQALDAWAADKVKDN